MDWFKHFTNATNDADISDAEDVFGDAGYVVYFKMMEIYGDDFHKIDDEGFLRVSKGFLSRRMRKKFKKIETILKFFERCGKLRLRESDEKLFICIPKFIELSSNWTKRVNSKTSVGATAVPTAKEVEVEVEVKNTAKTGFAVGDDFFLTRKKRKLKGKKLDGFNLFWGTFNLKKGKAEAADSWFDISDYSLELEKKIIAAAKTEAKNRPELQSQGKTPKWAQGWITARRWEDESYWEERVELDEPYIPTSEELEEKYG